MSRLLQSVASPRLLRLLLGLCALALATCDSLWTPFQGANPNNCVATPDRCPGGQVCNPLTKQCENPPTTLSLVAGGLGAAGDGVGAGARFQEPHWVALDGAGRLFVADNNNHTIRQISLSTGAVTTIAGLAGTFGSADGTGASARFKDPNGIAFDATGTLYVADTNNHTIRKVDLPTGAVTTIAGTAGMPGATDGIGAAARFDGPLGIVSDGAGTLYVADYNRHIIRKVVLSSGMVSTVAGTAAASGGTDGVGAAARFRNPQGVALDLGGALYVADYGNHTIRKVMLSTAAVSTVAGMAGMSGASDGIASAARFNSPIGMTFDSVGALYVTEHSNHTVRKVMVNTGAVTTLAGAALQNGSADGLSNVARFFGPIGIAADGSSGLYIVDSGNHTIRKITLATDTVTTLAGSAGLQTTLATGGSADGVGAAARFNTPEGIAFDGDDTLYVAEYRNHTIRKVVVSTGTVTTLVGTAGMPGSDDAVGAAARIQGPYGLAADGAGNLYLADTNNHTIRKVVISTGAVTTVAGKARMPGSLDGVGPLARFNSPFGIAADRTGTLYVADIANYTVRKVDAHTGEVSTLAGTSGTQGSTDGPGSSALFSLPAGVAVDSSGNVYVTDVGNGNVRQIASTGEVTTLAGMTGMPGSTDGPGPSARFISPMGVAFDGAGTLYIADTGNSTIRKLDLRSNVVTTVVGTPGAAGVRLGRLPGRLNGASWVAVSPTGRLFISEAVENAILRVE